MKKYSRVSYAQRCQIFSLLQAKCSINSIAIILKYHRSTIYRELRRNRIINSKSLYDSVPTYTADEAQFKSVQRAKNCCRKLKITGKLQEEVVKRLRKGWSPEQICGRLKHEKSYIVTHQSVYNFIRKNSQYRNYLLYQGKRHYRHKRGNSWWSKEQPVWMKPISERSSEANNRVEIGHWERDLMYGLKRSPILVCTDRKSRLTKIQRLRGVTTEEVSHETEKLLNLTKQKIHSLTNDRGIEFKSSRALPYPAYYCDPYRPQQRGTVENTIGVIRRFIKNKTNLDTIDFFKLENWLNERPRKVLDYLTPFEVFYNQSVALES